MSNTRKLTKPAAAVPEEETFEYAGESYTITRDQCDDLVVLELFGAGNPVDATRHLLGAEDWARFLESIRTESGRLPASKTLEFVELVAGEKSLLGKFVSSLKH